MNLHPKDVEMLESVSYLATDEEEVNSLLNWLSDHPYDEDAVAAAQAKVLSGLTAFDELRNEDFEQWL